jgi:hypothetical protein
MTIIDLLLGTVSNYLIIVRHNLKVLHCYYVCNSNKQTGFFKNSNLSIMISLDGIFHMPRFSASFSKVIEPNDVCRFCMITMLLLILQRCFKVLVSLPLTDVQIVGANGRKLTSTEVAWC